MKLITTRLFILAFLFFSFSCRKNDKKETAPDVSLSINNVAYTVPFVWGDSLNHNGGTARTSIAQQYAGAYVVFTKAQLDSSFDKLLSLSTGLTAIPKSDLLGLVYYANGDYTNIPFANIKGISIFLKNGQLIKHKYLSKVNSAFSEIAELNCDVNNYYNHDFYLLLQKYAGLESPMNSYLFTTTTELNNYPTSSTEIFLAKRLVELNFKLPGNEDDGDGSAKCGKPCPRSAGLCNEKKEKCSECLDGVLRTANTRFGIGADLSGLVQSAAYDFRDNFLRNYTLGRKYIVYYYKLSYAITAINPISTDNFSENLSVALALYSIASRLQYGANDLIVYDDAVKNKLVTLIDKYKTYSTNADYQRILDIIKADVLRFANKTRATIIAQLN
jgi:hypothetical protein